MAKIFIMNEGLGAEFIAALQSYYSRDPGSAYQHTKKAWKENPKEFLEKFYKKYAHKSIGQTATITLFIEGVSILFPKALQDSPYYNGQEASTRYINFAEQGFANPFDEDTSQLCISDIVEFAKNDVSEDLLQWLDINSNTQIECDIESQEAVDLIKNKWMEFYSEHFNVVSEMLRQQKPKGEKESDVVYKNAIYSRTCDILRAFLPAGMKTLLSWHTTLDHANDMLRIMKHHPATEIRMTSRAILKALTQKFPETFSENIGEDLEKYNAVVAKTVSYYDPETWDVPAGEVGFNLDHFDVDALREFGPMLKQRPKYGAAHRLLGRAGLIGIQYLQDFGSARDTLRHRPGINQVPLLTTKYGFEPWYLDQLPPDLKVKAVELITAQEERIALLGERISKYDLQYVIPLGYRVPLYHNWPFNQLIYVPELRTGATVHPTVQRIQRTIADFIQTQFGSILGDAYYPSMGDGQFSLRRGTQTIPL